MKASFFLIIAVLSVLFLSTLVLAEPIELKLEKTNLTLKMGDEVNIKLNLSSALNFTAQKISLYPEPAVHMEWLTFDKNRVELFPNASRHNGTLTVFASNDIGRYSFNIIAENEQTPEVRSVVILNILSIPPDSFLVTEFKAEKTGSQIPFSIKLRTVDTKTAKLLVELTNSKGTVVKTANLEKEITEKGVIHPPFRKHISQICAIP